MHDLTAERTILCPTCWEPNTLALDLTATAYGSIEQATLEQGFVEDCEVCCNPMSITMTIEDGEVVSLEAESA